MTTFIYDVLNKLNNDGEDFSNLTFVLPSKRAGVFLRNELANIVNKTIFSPLIISIEEFVQDLAQLTAITNTELLFEFYNTYSIISKKEELDTFENFSKWAQILLQDFNEIDRYLIPQEKIFDYLSAIKELEHWSVGEGQTTVIKNYLKFWDKLKLYYNHYTQTLLNKKVGYQGLIYREAVENIEAYINSNQGKKHVFLGFNALNTAEETIIQELLQNEMASVYWDIDQTFIESKYHDAGLFTRQHKANWKYFVQHPFSWIGEHYKTSKNISIFGVPKNIGQAKTISTILNELAKKDTRLKNTAVVLGDENLLIPVLNSIPENVETLNITMGFPLKSIPLASLFEHLFTLQKKNKTAFYFKDVISILSHQYVRPLFLNDNASKAIERIQTNNLIYLTKQELKNICNQDKKIINLLFSSWDNITEKALEASFKLIQTIKQQLQENKKINQLSLEYLFRFNKLFNELFRLNQSSSYIKDVSALSSIYKELLSTETLDFQGEPLQGLQIMGMLESRVLDFETVIISNVNEGVLPSGKTNNSFIPFDVKIENNLPTYKEKDAVYTYHFYRLLQRAKNIYILYNTEIDALTGGEKSRFINQLELEGIHNIEHKIVTPKVPSYTKALKQIKKTTNIINGLKNIASYGFSPSALISYMRNPVDFYYQKLLGVKDLDEVEETVAYNTLGTVVHNTLEELYKPYIGKSLTVEAIKKMTPSIETLVTKYFKDEYKDGDISQGKNLIIFEIAKRYVQNFLNLETEDLKQGNTIKIIALEAKSKVSFPIPELNFEVNLKGTVDRVDEYNGVTRIIDYKTGKVEQNKVEVINWEDITTDYDKYSKSFQILTYAYMINKSKSLNFPIEAGIISFKNLSEGFLKFAKKTSAYDKNKATLITQDTLDDFAHELKKLIIEICNPEMDFIEKEL